MQNISEADIKMITSIGKINTKSNSGTKNKVKIFDARPHISAQGNKFKGGGFEDVKNYPDC